MKHDIRKIIYLEPDIIDKIDEFREIYAFYYRGQILNMVIGLFGLLNNDEQTDYFEQAHQYVAHHHIRTDYNKLGLKREGNIPVQMKISSNQNTFFKHNDDKIVVIAALLYAQILK